MIFRCKGISKNLDTQEVEPAMILKMCEQVQATIIIHGAKYFNNFTTKQSKSLFLFIMTNRNARKTQMELLRTRNLNFFR